MSDHVKALVLHCLRNNAEGSSEIDAAGHAWKDVYLDNAFTEIRKAGLFTMRRRAFHAYLGQLEREGLYRVIHGSDFGSVRK